MKLQISVVQVGQWTYIATICVVSVLSKSSNYNTTAHMGTVISLLRSCIKSCPILGVWGSVSFMNHSASDKTKSYLSCDCLMLEFADVWDSGFQSLHSQSSQFEWSRESGECGVGIIACLFTFLHWLHCSEFPGRVHHLIVEPYEICALSRVTFFSFCCCCRNTAKRKRSMRCVWKASTLWFLSLSGCWLCFPLTS